MKQQADDKVSGENLIIQETKIIKTIENMELCIEKIHKRLENLFLLKIDEIRQTIQVGYNLGGDFQNLIDLSQMILIEQHVYMYQIVVMMS